MQFCLKSGVKYCKTISNYNKKNTAQVHVHGKKLNSKEMYCWRSLVLQIFSSFVLQQLKNLMQLHLYQGEGKVLRLARCLQLYWELPTVNDKTVFGQGRVLNSRKYNNCKTWKPYNSTRPVYVFGNDHLKNYGLMFPHACWIMS